MYGDRDGWAELAVDLPNEGPVQAEDADLKTFAKFGEEIRGGFESSATDLISRVARIRGCASGRGASSLTGSPVAKRRREWRSHATHMGANGKFFFVTSMTMRSACACALHTFVR